MSLPCLVFFFSSRRRHTRSKRDWSSDVCSSDLFPRWSTLPTTSPPARRCSRGRCSVGAVCRTRRWACTTACRSWSARSEERRVGKESGGGLRGGVREDECVVGGTRVRNGNDESQ